MAGFIEILYVMICARITMIRWVITYLDIIDLEQVVDLAIIGRRSLAPYLNVLDLVYSDN